MNHTLRLCNFLIYYFVIFFVSSHTNYDTDYEGECSSSEEITKAINNIWSELYEMEKKRTTREEHMENAKEQFNVLLCQYQGIIVRHRRAKQQNNPLFIHHLEIKLDTIDGVLSMYKRYIEGCSSKLETLEIVIEELQTKRDELELKLNNLPENEYAGCLWL